MRSDEEFLSEVKQQLQQSSDALDELTLAKLGAARRRAVEVGSRPAVYRFGDVLFLGRGGMAILILAGLLLIASAVLLKTTNTPVEQQMQSITLLEDMELLGAAQELEFYQELDFYLWVTDEQDSG
ncbi:MAG: hypothetical protein N0C88_20255 [Candidatus Thiodiazotropha lotti]|uniref:DUF3619 domain-containing protein n=1 Tax=Candidatus Thiodiazotropha lotti TaxID=2792787 RepID=A0A9E4N255_9GAMM|nr:hypothetical protein [Candidatus Thiodiazotropha lotti]MCG7941163.1 hypothetical protein [Candidatus Thiodiazotropha lotti]MCG7988863.1 hypothetical protein [Candidatus Thiodiazotropha lotti]MCG8013227.1 hypothetical protein [Candidatus Thiodiazotropha lotti]MCG8021925.1 hypothetical protein [Candidatus Thiodiazotropha lotti]